MILPILVDSNPGAERLQQLNPHSWEQQRFEAGPRECHYPVTTLIYILAGSATITSEDGAPLSLEQGTLLRIPSESFCLWEVPASVTFHLQERR
ncbi:MAG: cupin domain-containing protein [Trichlorobacter sp.]|jgi:uncharacterized cupin superfamily protein